MGTQAPVRAVVFDAYGTRFDVYSVELLAEQMFPGQGNALGGLWSDKQIEYTRRTAVRERYRTCREMKQTEQGQGGPRRS